MQCIKAFVAQQPDEISLEKADILLVHQQSNDGENLCVGVCLFCHIQLLQFCVPTASFKLYI